MYKQFDAKTCLAEGINNLLAEHEAGGMQIVAIDTVYESDVYDTDLYIMMPTVPKGDVITVRIHRHRIIMPHHLTGNIPYRTNALNCEVLRAQEGL